MSSSSSEKGGRPSGLYTPGTTEEEGEFEGKGREKREMKKRV